MSDFSKNIHYIGDSIAKLTVGIAGVVVINTIFNNFLVRELQHFSKIFVGQETLSLSVLLFLFAYPVGLLIESLAVILEMPTFWFFFKKNQNSSKADFYKKFDVLQKTNPDIAFNSHKIKFEGKVMYSFSLMSAALALNSGQFGVLFASSIVYFLASMKTLNFIRKASNQF